MSEVSETIRNYLSGGKKVLTEYESKELLEKIGIPIFYDIRELIKWKDE